MGSRFAWLYYGFAFVYMCLASVASAEFGRYRGINKGATQYFNSQHQYATYADGVWTLDTAYGAKALTWGYGRRTELIPSPHYEYGYGFFLGGDWAAPAAWSESGSSINSGGAAGLYDYPANDIELVWEAAIPSPPQIPSIGDPTKYPFLINGELLSLSYADLEAAGYLPNSRFAWNGSAWQFLGKSIGSDIEGLTPPDAPSDDPFVLPPPSDPDLPDSPDWEDFDPTAPENETTDLTAVYAYLEQIRDNAILSSLSADEVASLEGSATRDTIRALHSDLLQALQDMGLNDYDNSTYIGGVLEALRTDGKENTDFLLQGLFDLGKSFSNRSSSVYVTNHFSSSITNNFSFNTTNIIDLSNTSLSNAPATFDMTQALAVADSDTGLIQLAWAPSPDVSNGVTTLSGSMTSPGWSSLVPVMAQQTIIDYGTPTIEYSSCGLSWSLPFSFRLDADKILGPWRADVRNIEKWLVYIMLGGVLLREIRKGVA